MVRSMNEVNESPTGATSTVFSRRRFMSSTIWKVLRCPLLSTSVAPKSSYRRGCRVFAGGGFDTSFFLFFLLRNKIASRTAATFAGSSFFRSAK